MVVERYEIVVETANTTFPDAPKERVILSKDNKILDICEYETGDKDSWTRDEIIVKVLERSKLIHVNDVSELS